MIIPVDRNDLAQLLEAAKLTNPEIVSKYNLAAVDAKDVLAPGELTRNVIELDLQNIKIIMTNGQGEPMSHNDKDACRSHRFRVKLSGLPDDLNDKITAFIEKVELPELNYGSNSLAKTKITFYNINNEK